MEDQESPEETAHLMRSPANARRLRDAIARLEGGSGDSRDPLDEG